MAQRSVVDSVNQEEPETSLEEIATAYVPRTELGRRLMAIRERVVRSGAPLLDWDEVEREVAARRGGVRLGDEDQIEP